MKKIYHLFILFILVLVGYRSNAQITGIKNIPVDYPTIEAAVAALNSVGVGVGGATINVPAGSTETPTAPIILTMTANPSTVSNPLVFRKTGVGANPLITAFSPGVSTTVDGIFILNGTDYVTIDGIDVQENVLNTTPTMQMEWGYALVKANANDGAQNNIIKNCSVTLSNSNTGSVGIYLGNHLAINTTALVISISGTSSFNKFLNNSIQNCYIGYSITGFNSAAPYDGYDQNNQIGVDGISTKRSQITNFGGGAVTANGIFATNQNGFKVFSTYISNFSGPASTGVINGMQLVTGTNSNLDVYNDTLKLNSNSTISTMIGINNAMGATGSGNTVNIYNNVIDGCTNNVATSATFRAIMHSATASFSNLYNNKISNNTLSGTGEFSALYYSGSSATLVNAVKIYSNTINGNTKTGTAGTFYGIYASASTFATDTYSNQIYNNSNSASSGATYGYYNFAIGYNENVYNNTLYNNTGGSGETVMLYIRSGSGPTNKEVYGNTIYNISGNSLGSSVGAIWVDYGTVCNVYKNNIYNITNNTTTGAVPAAYGLNVGTNINTQVKVFNNFISEIKAPNASNVNAIYGIWFQGSATSNLSAYYNTVYLNAVSTGVNFGTGAFVTTATPFTVDLRNNIFVNNSTPAGTGLTRALVRASTVLTNYNLLSGYNCLYAGTPGPSNLIFTDGTNNLQTLQAFKNLVGPREQASFSSLPPFVNIATGPYDLHLQNSIATQCEGGGIAISSITNDFDLNARNAPTPDVGADEISGITVDIASPDIQYVPLTNAGVAANRNVPNFATITDPSGINTTAGTKPRLYYKKTTNANTFIGNTSADDCWKFVEATNSSTPYSFNINYALLLGGSVSAGDVIQYFVTAQDLNSTPNIGLNNGGFTSQPASVNLSAANFPLNNTINQYTIVANVYSGTINVGPTELVTSLTNPSGMFDLINNGALSGNLTLNITGDLTAETGAIALNQWAEDGVGNYTLTMVPSAAVTRSIVGSSAANALVRFNGADRVNIDGRFANAGTFLLFRNTSNSAPSIGYLNDAQNHILQYSIIESGNTAVSTALGGAVLIGTTTGLNGNDNITIANNEIRDRSDVLGTPAIGINCVGTNAALTQFNNNNVIKNNNIHDWFLLNSASQFGISIGTANSGYTITGNSFYQTAARTNNVSGASTRAININFAATVNSNGGNYISGNYIGGSAPLAAGNDMTLTVSGAGVSQNFIGINATTGLIPNFIDGNVIQKIDFITNAPTGNTSVWIGISTGQGIYSIGTLTGNILGASTGNGINKITINSGGAGGSFMAGIISAAVSGYSDIRNNIIGGFNISGTNATANILPQWIQLQGTPVQSNTVTNNLIGSLTTANSIANNTSAPYISFGIRQLISSGVGLSATTNTIQNLTDNSTAATSANYGVLIVSTVGSQGSINVSNNVIKDHIYNGLPAAPTLANMGIACQGMAGITHSFDDNNISGLSCANTGAGAGYAVGIQSQGNSFGGNMRRNYIYNLSNANTGTTPGIAGVYINSGLNWGISNNMISLSNGTNTNNVTVLGVGEYLGGGCSTNLSYNSIYIAGNSPSGTANSFAFLRGSNDNVTLRNNLFYNERAGATATHAAISSSGLSGWYSNSSDYNAFILADTSVVGLWNSTGYNLTGWKTTTGGDLNTVKNINTAITNPALFVNASTGNLHINTSTFPGGLGTPISITTDIDNNARSATFPAVGADEIPCPSPVVSVASQSNVTCFGGNNGLAVVTATGGSTFSYSWAPISNTTNSITNVTAGNYTVSVTNNCSLTTNQTIIITQPSSITPNATQTNVSCFGGNNGVASLSVTGGVSPYTYTWSPTSATAASISTLIAGTYNFTVTDFNNCVISNNVVITQPTSITVVSSTSVACTSQNNGVVSLTVTGGTPSYTYSWTPSVSTSSVANNLAAGSYSTLITDGNGCTTPVQVNSVSSIPGPTVSISSTTNQICQGQAVTLSATGAPSYSWSNGSTATINVVSPTVTTTYTLTGTNPNGCQAFAYTTVSVSPCTGLANSYLNKADILVYPNPSNGLFFINHSNFNDVISVEVYNSIGQLLISKSLTTSITEIDMANYKNGIYFVKVLSKDKLEYVTKIVKE